ncbi:Ribonuclease H-like domain [Cinara cedri]|uniref:Ribonuclease H-like domain n=1 Tax=Cinara cedri TaxID=506608 RepID=A0A5E4NIH9_9HEMI|nr:Ribonuclease H-like domain [Cinara cedri]
MTARAVVGKCVKCVRASPKFTTLLMGQLTKDRVPMSRPFSMIGVDFAGPFIRSGICRITGNKAWKSVLICFATKAVHLEIVEDMTSNAFMACLRIIILVLINQKSLKITDVIEENSEGPDQIKKYCGSSYSVLKEQKALSSITFMKALSSSYLKQNTLYNIECNKYKI